MGVSTSGREGSQLAFSSRVGADQEGQQRIGYDAFGEPTMNARYLRSAAVPGWWLRMIAVLPSRCSAGTLINARSGRRPCENYGTFSHGPISFAFSSPETVQRNYGNLRSARPVGKFRGVLTRPRS